MRLLLPILLILSTLHSTVFSFDDLKCSNHLEYDSLNLSSSAAQNNSSSDANSTPHNDQSCFQSHCHSCHFAVIGKHEVIPFILNEMLSLTFKSLFYPKGFALEILRPPIV